MSARKVLIKIIRILLLIYLLIIPILYFFQDKIIFFPEKLPGDYKFSFNDSFEELFFPTARGVVLNALLFKAPESKGVVLYFHGNAGNLKGWGSLSGQFTSRGYDLLIFDYRGYGKSTGSLTQNGLYEDAFYLYDRLMEQYEENSIIIYGRSIGTGIAAKVASERNPGLLIMESPYYNMKDLVRNKIPFIPTFFLKYTFRTDLFLEKVNCPIYLFHGTQDELIYYGSSLKLKEKYPRINLIPITGGHHNDLSGFKAYHRGLGKILQSG